MVKLRGYQETAIDGIISHIADGNTNIVMVAPTGSGKSKIATALVDNWLNCNYKILFVTTINTLIEQTLNHFNNLNVSGVIGDRRVYPEPIIDSNKGCVVIGSLQSIASRPHWLKIRWDAIIFDEAHTSAFFGVADKLEARIKIGLTATPCRGDKIAMSKVFNQAVIVSSFQELVDQGHLARLEYYGLAPKDLPDLSQVKVGSDGEYLLEQLETVCNTEHAINLALDARHKYVGDDAPTLAFCTTVAHVRQTVEIARKRGIKADGIVGDTKDRQALFNKLRDGELSLLVSCKALSTGTDLPFVTCGLLMYPHNTEAPHTQEIGRVARPSPGKTHGVIIDAVGNCLRLGLAEERVWTPKEALGIYEPKKLTAKQCHVCYGVNPSKAEVCQHCGTSLVIEREASGGKQLDLANDVDGQYVRITASGIARLKNGTADTSEYREYWRTLLRQAYAAGDIRNAWKNYVKHEFPKHPKPDNHWGLHAVLGENPPEVLVAEFQMSVLRSSFSVAADKREWWRKTTMRNELGDIIPKPSVHPQRVRFEVAPRR